METKSKNRGLKAGDRVLDPVFGPATITEVNKRDLHQIFLKTDTECDGKHLAVSTHEDWVYRI